MRSPLLLRPHRWDGYSLFTMLRKVLRMVPHGHTATNRKPGGRRPYHRTRSMVFGKCLPLAVERMEVLFPVLTGAGLPFTTRLLLAACTSDNRDASDAATTSTAASARARLSMASFHSQVTF